MTMTKEKVTNYLGKEDMEQKLALSNMCKVFMSQKFDGHWVTIYHDGETIRIISAGGHMFKYCLGLEAMPNFPAGVELRAELVFEKETAKSSYEQFLDTNAMFSRCHLKDNEKNPYLDFRDLPEWDRCDENGVLCQIAFHVHGLVHHEHDLNTALVAQYLEGASKNIKQIEWTLVTSVQQAQERLQAEFDANHEGLMFFKQKFGNAACAIGNAKSNADSRSCSPEPLLLINSKWIKGKLRKSFTGTVVRLAQDGTVWVPRVHLDNYPLDIAEMTVRLGNRHGFHPDARVRVDVVQNSPLDRRPQHVINMDVVGAAKTYTKRKRD